VRRVRDIGQVLADPQLESRDMVATLLHPTVGPTRVMGTPLKLSATPASLRTPPPTLGQHTDDVLAELASRPATSRRCGGMGWCRLRA